MKARSSVNMKILWWILGSLGVSGVAVTALMVVLVITIMGMLVASSDSPTKAFPVRQPENLDVPIPLLSLYLQAQNGNDSWARLAAINKVTTDFGERRTDDGSAVGFLRFPLPLWQSYQMDGDGDGEADGDNPYDAVFSLAHYLNQQTGVTFDQALETFQLTADEIAQVKGAENQYASSLILQNGWLWPLVGYTNLSSPYGYRTDPITGERAFHDGIDIPAPWGNPVLAIRSGTVIFASEDSSGYGNLIRIQHDEEEESFYGHLSVIGVKRGQQVHQGEVIGLVGTTGKSTGPHLHVGFVQNGESMNPLSLWFRDAH